MMDFSVLGCMSNVEGLIVNELGVKGGLKLGDVWVLMQIY